MYAEADRAAAAQEAASLCQYQLGHHLAKSMQRVVVIAGSEAYFSWSAYVAAFMERGGVIEACASGMFPVCMLTKRCTSQLLLSPAHQASLRRHSHLDISYSTVYV